MLQLDASTPMLQLDASTSILFQHSNLSSSHMLCSTNHLSTYFCPVDAIVEIFIDQTANGDVITSNKIETMTDFRTWLRVVRWSNDSFDGVVEDDVGELVAGKKSADQGATVSSDDEDLLVDKALQGHRVLDRKVEARMEIHLSSRVTSLLSRWL